MISDIDLIKKAQSVCDTFNEKLKNTTPAVCFIKTNVVDNQISYYFVIALVKDFKFEFFQTSLRKLFELPDGTVAETITTMIFQKTNNVSINHQVDTLIKVDDPTQFVKSEVGKVYDIEKGLFLSKEDLMNWEIDKDSLELIGGSLIAKFKNKKTLLVKSFQIMSGFKKI